MLAYHIDDGDYITHEGQILELSNDFPNDWYTNDVKALCLDLLNGEGAAHWGIPTLATRSMLDRSGGTARIDGNFANVLTELYFEVVRQKHFPDAPSRLQCLFACVSEENIEYWKSKLPPQPNGATWLVEGDTAFVANARFLRSTRLESNQLLFDPALARRMALMYWGTGKLLDASQCEGQGRECARSDLDFLLAHDIYWDGERQPEILLKYPVKIVRKC